MTKTYLGDGVYAEMEGTDLILTTSNGMKVTNRIILEPDVLDRLNQYLHMWFLERNKKK